MILNQTSEVAIKVLILLARDEGGPPWPVREINQAVGGSATYLAKTIRDLVRAGLLRSQRGAHGGVTLARSPATISLLEIVEAAQGVIGASYCRSPGDVGSFCAFHHAMLEVRRSTLRILSRWTLRDLAESSSAIEECKMKLPVQASRG